MGINHKVFPKLHLSDLVLAEGKSVLSAMLFLNALRFFPVFKNVYDNDDVGSNEHVRASYKYLHSYSICSVKCQTFWDQKISARPCGNSTAVPEFLRQRRIGKFLAELGCESSLLQTLLLALTTS